LATSLTNPLQFGREIGQFQGGGNGCSQQASLVVSAFLTAARVQRHRHYTVIDLPALADCLDQQAGQRFVPFCGVAKLEL
jgi:hypothetical protein